MLSVLRNKSNGVAAADGRPNGGGPVRDRSLHEAIDYTTDADLRHPAPTVDADAVTQGGMILRRCVVVQEDALFLDDNEYLY